MLDFLIDNIFFLSGEWVFQQTIGISMGTKYAPILSDLLLHAYEVHILQGFLKNKDRKLAQTFNSIFRYIYAVPSLNNSRFAEYLHPIYPNEPEVKETTEAQISLMHIIMTLIKPDLALTIKRRYLI